MAEVIRAAERQGPLDSLEVEAVERVCPILNLLATHVHVGTDAVHSYRMALEAAAAQRTRRIQRDDRSTAIAHLDAARACSAHRPLRCHLPGRVAAYVDSMIERGFFPPGLSRDAYYARSHKRTADPIRRQKAVLVQRCMGLSSRDQLMRAALPPTMARVSERPAWRLRTSS
jgi:hypothetical protein